MENDNHTFQLLTTEESLPRYSEDTPEQLIARKVYAEQVKRRLESLDTATMSFQGSGEVEVVLRIAGKNVRRYLPIKSLPGDLLAELAREYNVCAAKLPRSWNKEGGEWDEQRGCKTGGWDQDPAHPRYAEVAGELARLSRKLNYDKVLHGLDIDITDGRKVLWSADPEGPRDYETAIKKLSKLGLTDAAIERIAEAIDNLSLQVEEDDEEEWVKKTTQH